MSKPPTGYIENIELRQDPTDPSEWNLVGDITVESGSLDEAIGGFSISFLEPIFEGTDPSLGLIYVPYPFYNDAKLMGALRGSSAAGVGKWVKKGVDVPLTALVLGGTYFFLKPLWDQVYAELLEESVSKIIAHFKRPRELLSEREIGFEFAQLVDWEGSRIEVRFIPNQNELEAGLTTSAIVDGIQTVQKRLAAQAQDSERRITRFVMRYDSENKFYYIDRFDHSQDLGGSTPPPPT